MHPRPPAALLHFLDGDYGGLWRHRFGTTGGSLVDEQIKEWTDDSAAQQPISPIVGYPVISPRRPEDGLDPAWPLRADGWFRDRDFDNYLTAERWLHLDMQANPLPPRDTALIHKTVQYYHWICPVEEGCYPRIDGPAAIRVMLYQDGAGNGKGRSTLEICHHHIKDCITYGKACKDSNPDRQPSSSSN